jgi:hypothetical protein
MKGDEELTKLDYTIEFPEERKKIVEQILAETPNITDDYMENLADYMILCMEKQEKKQKKLLTENRMTTINKRETYFEDIANTLEAGEDGIYNLMSDSKTIIFQPKISITQKDIETIPELKQLRESIEEYERALKRTSGKNAFRIKKALIEIRKDQYVIKQAYQRPIVPNKITRSSQMYIPLEDKSHLLKDGTLVVKGVSLMNSETIGTILQNYPRLKEDSYDRFDGDTWYLMEAFDEIAAKALEPYPLYEKLVTYKIDGCRNDFIQEELEKEFGIKHTQEYISSLWRNKIPKLIAAKAQEDYIEWQFRTKNLPFKTCSRCGQSKPAHNHFFSKNSTSKDSFYSICKCCRNNRQRKD